MKLISKISILSILLFIHPMLTFAAVDHYFTNMNGCLILFDVTKNKLLTEYHPKKCDEQVSPNSTFKIPLSLMAFDQKIINEDTMFKWDGKIYKHPFWNQDQSAQSWIQNSVVWVSQSLTPKIGINNIKNYLKAFHYGNEDFSGDSNYDGLTHAWLDNSLKISPMEQLSFMKAFVEKQLPVSSYSLAKTKFNIYLETSATGWKLYGKTGTGETPEHLERGWFVGFVERGKEKYIVIVNFTDLQKTNSNKPGGIRAKNIAKAYLTKMHLF